MNGHLFERIAWNIIWTLFIRPFPRRIATKWEVFILRLFGAKVDYTCTIYSSAKIWLPRNLKMDRYATIADHVEILNGTMVHLKEHSRVSQYSYLCPGSHDISDFSLKRIDAPIVLEEWSWVTAKCYIGMGVKIGRGAVVSSASVVTENVPPYAVVMGNPAKVVGFRYTPHEIIKKEVFLFAEDNRMSSEMISNNYKKYFLSRIADIKKYVKI